MADKYITATLHHMSPVPPGSVYRGDQMVEFKVPPGRPTPENITKKYAEYDPEDNTYFKDPAVKLKLASDDAVAEAEKIKPVTKVSKPKDKVAK